MRSKLALTAVLVLTLSACAKPPQMELDAAKADLTAAEQAEAAKYASAELDAAKQALDAANAEIEAQKAKFALTRSYEQAKQMLADATAKSKAAAAAAVAGKEAAKAAAQAGLDAVNAALASTETLMAELEACPRKPKGFSTDMEALKANYDGLKAGVDPISSQIGSEDFLGAKSAADTLKAQIDTLAADLAGAKEKIKC